MTKTKGFWIAQMVLLLAFYAYAACQLAQGHRDARPVWVAGLVLAAHVLELPLAFNRLKSLNPAPLRVVIGTLLFGLIWWVPAQRGIFSAR